MGTVTQQLAAAAIQAGAQIHTNCPVAEVEVSPGGGAAGVVLQDGRRVAAKAVVTGCGGWPGSSAAPF